MRAEIVISVDGLPPAKGGASIVSVDHRHHPRVLELLRAARATIPADFVPFREALSLTLLVRAPTRAPRGDPTNFLGGVADALQRKPEALELREFGTVMIYEDDLQLRHIEYQQVLASQTSYEVRIRSMGGPDLVRRFDESHISVDERPLVANVVIDVIGRDDLAIEFVNVLERPRRRDISIENASQLVGWLDLQHALPHQFVDHIRQFPARPDTDIEAFWRASVDLARALERLFLGERSAADLQILTGARRVCAAYEGIDLATPDRSLGALELEHADVTAALCPIVRSALRVLVPAVRDRLRVCADETCRRLFVDRTKNGSKMWCSNSCGNRAKVRAYRSRLAMLEEGAVPYVVD